MKRVKLLSQYCGASGVFPPGREIEVEDKEAKMLVNGGYAVAIEAPKPKTAAKKEEGK